MIKLCLAFVLLATAASAFVMKQDEPKNRLWVGSRNDLLKFENYSGPGATSRHITSFIKYANDATRSTRTTSLPTSTTSNR